VSVMPGDPPPSDGAKPNKQRELDRFRAAHPPSSATFEGVQWEWVSAGDGDLATFILPPAPGFAALTEDLIAELATRGKVIAPTYPPVPEAQRLVSGLVSICRDEGVRRLNLVGIGFGGILAQLVAQRGRNVVNKIVLVNTTTPQAWATPVSRSRYNLSRFVPGFLLRRWIAFRLMRRAKPDKAERARWRRLIRECVRAREDKWALLSLWAAGLDAQRIAIEDGGWSLTGYEGRILIIESSGDRSLSPAARRAQSRLPDGPRAQDPGRSALAWVRGRAQTRRGHQLLPRRRQHHRSDPRLRAGMTGNVRGSSKARGSDPWAGSAGSTPVWPRPAGGYPLPHSEHDRTESRANAPA